MANPTTSPKPRDGSQQFDKAKDAAGQAYEKSKDVMSSVGEAVSHAASAVGKTADNLTSAAGSGVKSLGDSIASHTPHEGMLGTASQAVASTVKQAGEYVEKEGLSGMMEDLTGVIRRNPVPAVLVGIAVGFLIGRTLGSS